MNTSQNVLTVINRGYAHRPRARSVLNNGHDGLEIANDISQLTTVLHRSGMLFFTEWNRASNAPPAESGT
jgi:hypothetical protein